MKRVLASILSLIMLFSVTGVVAAEGDICEIGDVGYQTLNAAFEAAESDATIKLLKDIALDDQTVTNTKKLTLDLNGKTITGTKSTKAAKNFAVILNKKGDLTITDSSDEGTGKITFEYTGESTNYGPCVNTVTNEQGILTVNGGTIENNTDVQSQISYAIDNLTNSGIGDATLNINGGKVSSKYYIAVRAFANCITKTNTINITDGEFYGRVQLHDANAKANNAVINISGGEFNANERIADALYLYAHTEISGFNVSITGGKFNGLVRSVNAAADKEAVTEFITGGKFTEDPSAYIKKGYARAEIEDETYKYSVVELKENAAQPVAPDANAGVAEDIDPEIKEEIVENAANTAVSGIDSFVNEVANNVNKTEVAEKEEVIEALGTEAEINVFVQPALDVTITDVDVVDGNPVITLDIEAKAQVIATTANNAEGIVTGDEGNAVVVETKLLNTKGQDVVITVPVPQSVAELGAVMVKHTKDDGKVYYYPATIDTVNKTITFVNPNGFSKFEISEEAQPLTIDFGTNKDKTGDAIADIEGITIYDIGTEIELVSAYKKNNYFDGWVFGDEKKEYKGKVELTEKLWESLTEEAVDGVVTATAKFTKEDDGGKTGFGGSATLVTYKVQFNSTGGTDVKDATVARGANLAEPQAPTKGDLIFGGWYTDRAYSTEYDFSKPVYSSFTLYAKWESAEGSSVIFDDVTENDWFFDVVNEAYEKGLMNGMREGEFAPTLEVTRGMFVTVLYRIAGEPAVSETVAFEDVAADKYYANAIAWATASGITNGMSETEFMPERSISREQMATILYRYAESAGEDVSFGDMLSFSDADSINDYAVSAIEWACAAGLMNGYPEGTFAPQNTATRAEAAAVLVRMAK